MLSDKELQEKGISLKKKRGRPADPTYYVNEKALRNEIEKSQKNIERHRNEFEKKYEKLLKEAKNDAERERILEQKEAEFEILKKKTFCTEELCRMIILTVERVATQQKFRNYSYLSDMKAEAIYQSLRGIVKFDLSKVSSDGRPASSFSYLTQIIINAFRQILNKEKKAREIKAQAIDESISNLDSHIDIDFESVERKKEKILKNY